MKTFTYSDRADFLALWDLARPLAEPAVVHWSANPSQEGVRHIRVMDHLTPIDWLVSYVLRFPGRELHRVWIVDRRQRPQLHARTFAMRWSPQVLQLLGGFFRLDGAPPPEPLDATERLHLQDAIHENLRELWRSRFLLRDDSNAHHDVSNIVGGLLLGAQTMGAQAPVEIVALQRHLGDLRMGPEEAALPAEGVPVGRFPRWMLIDDMARVGWERFLEGELGGGDLAAVTTDVRVLPRGGGPLVNALRKALGGPGASRALGARLIPEGARGAGLPFTPDVLFLDLYLVPDLAELEQWTRELVGIAEDFIAAAPGDGQTVELRALAQAAQARQAGRADLACVLPALVATAFPWLPIVLFSSTERREVAQKLAPFPNLILDFQKPPVALASTPGRFRRVAREGLRQALRRAERIRKLGRELDELRGRAAEGAAVLVPGGVVEVYLDESGEAPSAGGLIRRVGAIVAVYPDDATATELDREMCKTPATRVGWSGANHGQDRPRGYVGKEDVAGEMLAQTMRLAQEKGVRVWSFRFEIEGEVDPGAERFPDPNYFNLLRFALEAILYDWLAGVNPAQVRVFAAARWIPVDRGDARAWVDRHGLRRASASLVEILPCGVLHLVLQPLLAAHDYQLLDRIEQAMVVELAYFEARDGRGVPPLRQLHYLADVAAHRVRYKALARTEPPVSVGIDLRCTWDDLRDGAYSWAQHLRDASRHVDHGRPREAVLSWLSASRSGRLEGDWPALVARRVWTLASERLSPADYRALLERGAEESVDL